MKEIVIALLSAIIASSGFWALVIKRVDTKDNYKKLVVGLGHDRIMALGMRYIERGSITTEEYENLYEYLYKPYKECGGNGSAERIMQEVNKLPIKDN